MSEMRKAVVGVTFALLILTATPSKAEPNWIPVVFATGDLKERIDSTHILHRPYRPLHFYGNTVRRLHYRGRALPTIEDYRNTLTGLFGR